jgi:hypothetical protein
MLDLNVYLCFAARPCTGHGLLFHSPLCSAVLLLLHRGPNWNQAHLRNMLACTESYGCASHRHTAGLCFARAKERLMLQKTLVLLMPGA